MKAQTKKAPGGATRCRMFAEGISLYLFGSREAYLQWSLVWDEAYKQGNSGNVKVMSKNGLLDKIKKLHLMLRYMIQFGLGMLF